MPKSSIARKIGHARSQFKWRMKNGYLAAKRVHGSWRREEKT
jgi:hypothetical protein